MQSTGDDEENGESKKKKTSKEELAAPAGYTTFQDVNGNNIYIPTSEKESIKKFDSNNAVGSISKNNYKVEKGSVNSFKAEGVFYEAKWNIKTQEFLGYLDSDRNSYKSPDALKTTGTTATVGFGETRGLYRSSDGTKVGTKPQNWDYEMSQQLMEVRAAIEVVAKRNPSTHSGATPSSNPKNAEYYQRQFAISENFPDVPSEILDDENVKYFYLSKSSTSKHSGLSYKYNDITLVKSYGPFYNAGSGGDAKGSAIYINFYFATPKKN